MRRSVPAALGLTVALGIVPASGQGAKSEIAAGRTVALKICASCHVVAADQAPAPVLNPLAPTFAEIAARPNVTEAFLRDFLMKPHAEARRTSTMPAFLLSGSQTDTVVAYLMSLKPKQ